MGKLKSGVRSEANRLEVDQEKFQFIGTVGEREIDQ